MLWHAMPVTAAHSPRRYVSHFTCLALGEIYDQAACDDRNCCIHLPGVHVLFDIGTFSTCILY